jgi:hypothetical protein
MENPAYLAMTKKWKKWHPKTGVKIILCCPYIYIYIYDTMILRLIKIHV